LFELVIFDCDGVLVDSEVIANRVLAAAITEAGLPMTTDESMQLFMGRRWEDSLFQIERRLGRPLPDDFSDVYRSRRDAALHAELQPVEGIAAAIERIPIPRCVASSGPVEKIRFTLGRTGLLELFEGRIFSAHEVEHGKPAPDVFLYAAERMRAEPSGCAVVEDSLVGVESGLGAGMTVFGYCGHFDAEAMAAAGARPFAAMALLPELLAARH
jgi:HAD superfamily hydrolase (TIGR01509 family)